MQNIQFVQFPDGRLLKVITGNIPEQQPADGQMKLMTMPVKVDCKVPSTATTMLTLDGRNLIHILPPGTNILQIPGPLQLMPNIAVSASTSQTPVMSAMASVYSPSVLTPSSAGITTETTSIVSCTTNSMLQNPKIHVIMPQTIKPVLDTPSLEQEKKVEKQTSLTPLQSAPFLDVAVPQRAPSLLKAASNSVTSQTCSKVSLPKPVFQGNHTYSKACRYIGVNPEQVENQFRLQVCEMVLKGIVNKIILGENKALRQEAQKAAAEERLRRSIANKRSAVLFRHSEKVRKQIIHKKLLMEKDLYMEVQKEFLKEVAAMEEEAAVKKLNLNPVVRLHRLDVTWMNCERRCNAISTTKVSAIADAACKKQYTEMERRIPSQQMQKKNTLATDNVKVELSTEVPTCDAMRKKRCTELEGRIPSKQVQKKKNTVSNDNESVLGLPWDVEAKIVGNIGTPINSS